MIYKLHAPARHLGFPIIGVGGISDDASAQEMIRAGANLIHIHAGFVYRGPDVLAEIHEGTACSGRPTNTCSARGGMKCLAAGDDAGR